MIKIPEEITDYFSQTNLPIFWLLPEVMEKDTKIGIILKQFIHDYHDTLDNGLGDVSFNLSNYIQKSIAKKKIDVLLNDISLERPRPYNHPSLVDIRIDDNNLVDISEFSSSIRGFQKGAFVFEILPSIFTGSNSMYWACNKLIEISQKGIVKIRLDPLMVQNLSNYRRAEFKMWAYGKPLNWEEISSLKTQLHARWIPDPGWQEDVGFTDLVWDPRTDGIHFVCEEVPKSEEINVRGSRYFHGIYNPRDNCFVHCDGAVRLFSSEEATERLSSHVRKIGKIGRRIKLFQIDSRVSTEDWTSLITSYFVWNRDIENYFNN